MKRFLGAIRLIALNILLMLAVSLCAESILHARSLSIDEVRHVVVVAVSTLQNGSYIGVSADLYVRVLCPGNGHVYVETLPLSELDLQASTRIAAIVASSLVGIDFRRCDFYASIKADAPIVGGPSASGVTAVAFAAALLRLPLNNSVVMTGMIMPDGSIGPVGGIKYKLDAAAARGAKVFLVPYGQTVDYVYKVVIEQIGVVSVRRTVVEPIDLVEYGERLGIKVVPVSNVYEALELFTNGEYRLSFNVSEINSRTVKLYEDLKPLLRGWIKDLALEIDATIATCSRIEKDVLSNVRYRYGQRAYNYIVAILDNISESIEKLIAEAGDMISKNNLYSAASTYFQALIHAYTKLYVLRIINNSEFVNYRVDEINESAKQLIDSIHKVIERGAGLTKISIAINVLDRVYEALIYANKSLGSKDIISIANNLAYAEARLYTARLWSNLLDLDTVAKDFNKSFVNFKDIENMALYIDTLVRNLYTYIVSLSGSVQFSSEIDDALQMYRIAQGMSNPLDRLTLCISFISYAYLALVNTFSRSSEALVHILNSTTYANLGLLSDMIPPDVVLYLELAESSSGNHQIIALTKLSMLLAIYRVLSLISSSEVQNVDVQTEVGSLSGTAPVTITKTVTITVTTAKDSSNVMQYTYVPLILILITLIAVLAITLLTVFRASGT